MTTPDVPLRIEFSVELPGTPEQVWDAIATANGIASWFLRTEVDEREGGTIVQYMSDDLSSPGTITGWDPPRRFAYIEPDWATLAGREPSSVTPLANEFLIEAKSGGTCVLHVVSSAFGTGEAWEQQFLDDAKKGWLPYFDNLRLYLTHFVGQRVTQLAVSADLSRSADVAWPALRQAVGADEVGQQVKVRDVVGQVERIGELQPPELLLRVTDPVPGFLMLGAYDTGDYAIGEGVAVAVLRGYLFSPDAPDYVERETSAWKEWLDEAVSVEA
jgi:uncharacterized protein YndB with AHSA1/START domain